MTQLMGALVFAWMLVFTHPASAQPRGGEAVTFESRQGESHVTLRGVLYLPKDPPRGAVVLVHGSSGWTDHREGHYGRALSAAGYAALAIDTFGPRGVSNTAEDQSRISSTQMARDAFAARRFLIARGFDASKIAVMGFSKGGIAVLRAADRTYFPDESDRFTVAIPFYPGCNNRPREPKPASVMFMALGEKDDYTGVKPCQDIAADYARAGGEVVVKVYPNSTHGFDGNPELISAFRLSTVENYIDCVVDVEPDGTHVYRGGRYGLDDPQLLAEVRRTCMKKGATIWTNLRQKAQATEDVISFLDQRFGR